MSDDREHIGRFDPDKVDPEEAVGPAARGRSFATPDDVPTASYDHEEEEFEEPEPLDAPEKKEAAEMAPPHTNPPMSDQMETPDLDEAPRDTPEGDTDLNAHGAPDAARERIQERIDNLKSVEQGEKQLDEDGKEVVEEEFEEQQAEHASFQSEPTSLEVDRSIEQSSQGDTRSNMESTSGYQTPSRFNSPKMASKPLEVLAQPEVSPIRIMVELDDAWGDEWLDWEYETIFQTAHNEGVDIQRQNEDKIMALKVLLNTNRFWEESRVFEKVCLAFNHKIVDWMVVQEPGVHEMSAARALIDRYIDEQEFSDEVKTYVAGVAIHAGFVMLPPLLRFASEPFSKKLMENMGDEALDRQESLLKALQQNNPELVDEGGKIQFFRLLRCHYHAQEALDNV